MFLIQTWKSYAVHYKSWGHILDSPASGYPGAYKLINIHHLVIFAKPFLHRFISEVSRHNVCKFVLIASNSLQVIKIVHKLFDSLVGSENKGAEQSAWMPRLICTFVGICHNVCSRRGSLYVQTGKALARWMHSLAWAFAVLLCDNLFIWAGSNGD